MNKLLEGILDDDKDIESKINDEIDRQIIECMTKYAWISTDTGLDRATANDYTIKDHAVYLDNDIRRLRGLKFFQDAVIPDVFRIGYCGKEFSVINSDVTNLEHIFDKLSKEGLKDIYYISIEGNKNLTKVPNFSKIKFNNLYILVLRDNPKLKVNAKELPDTMVSLTVWRNKNKIDIQELDKKLRHQIIRLDDYTNESDY